MKDAQSHARETPYKRKEVPSGCSTPGRTGYWNWRRKGKDIKGTHATCIGRPTNSRHFNEDADKKERNDGELDETMLEQGDQSG